jgi:hypothetical protein
MSKDKLRMASLYFEPVAVEHPLLLRLMSAFRDIDTVCGVQFVCFMASGLVHWLQEHWDVTELCSELLSSPALGVAAPDLVRGALRCDPEFSYIHPLALDGEIARRLELSGAGTYFMGTRREAKFLAIECCEVLLTDDYLDAPAGMDLSRYRITVCQSTKPWSWWFTDSPEGWNVSWIVVDSIHDLVWLMCVNDID